jgi:hypothetical protein
MPRSRPADGRVPAAPPVASTELRPRPTPHPRVAGYPRAAGDTLPAPEPLPRSAPAHGAERGVPPEEPTAPPDDVAAEPDDARAQGVAEEGVAEELAALGEAVPPVVDVWALVRQSQDGDAEAFGRLYDHYVTMVHRYLLHRVGDRAQAEDRDGRVPGVVPGVAALHRGASRPDRPSPRRHQVTTHDGAGPPGGRRAVVREQEDAVVARLQQLAADLDDAPGAPFRIATRDRLVAMAAVRPPQPAARAGLRRLLGGRAGSGPPAAWRTRLTAGLAGAAMTVTALGTLVALSTDARPGDVLYDVKRGTEQTQLALAGDDRGRTLLEFAETRLDELAALRHPAADDVLGLLDTMDAHAEEGASLLATQAVAGRDAAPVVGLADWAGRQSAELTALQARLPSGAATASQESLDLLARVSDRATGLRAALACADGPATAGTDELGPVPVECPGEAPEDGPPAEEIPSGGTGDDGGLPSGDVPASDGGAPPAGTAADAPVPAPQPAPAPAPSAPGSGGGDRSSGPSPDDGGPAPVVPDAPAVESPLPVPDLPVPQPTPVVPAEPDAPLLDTPLPICIRPLVC